MGAIQAPLRVGDLDVLASLELTRRSSKLELERKSGLSEAEIAALSQALGCTLKFSTWA